MRDVSEAYWLLYEDRELPPDEALKRAAKLRTELDEKKGKLLAFDARLAAVRSTLFPPIVTAPGWQDIPFPHTRTPQEFVDGMNAIAKAIKDGVIDPVTLLLVEADHAPSEETAHDDDGDAAWEAVKRHIPRAQSTPFKATGASEVKMSEEELSTFRKQRVAFEYVQRTVLKHWPQYWPFCEALLSTTATLLLKNVPAAIALYGVGDSGVGKNTVFKMFGWELERIILWRDKFSIAALQSHHGDDSRKNLTERALFRRARHKLLLTPELGILYRGRTQILEERFAELAQWLDGEGRITDAGTHGALGAKGDFTFVWGAGTTPFHMSMWTTMAALGTRLLFFEVRKGAYIPDDVYPIALAECRDAVNAFLEVFMPEGSVRQSEWPVLDGKIAETIQKYAALLALGHGIRQNAYGDVEIHFPSPNHFRSRLGIILRGRALVLGRTEVLWKDLEMARWIVQSSMPGRRGPVLLALLDGKCGVDEIAKSTGLTADVVRNNLAGLVQTGVVDKVDAPTGSVGRPPTWYRLNEERFESML